MLISWLFGDVAFLSYYVSLPFLFCMEITLYVFLAISVFLSRDPGWVFTPSTREKPINQSNHNCVNVIGLVLPAFCFLHTLLSLPPLSSPPLSNQSPIRTSGYRFKNLPTALTKRCMRIPESPSWDGICSNIVVFGRRKVEFFVDQSALQLRCSRQHALCRGECDGGW